MKNIRNDREIVECCAEFLKKFEARVAALEGQIASKVDEKQVREIVGNITTDSIIKEPPTQSHEAVLATVKDCRDSINREANFIMFRVEECDSEEAIVVFPPAPQKGMVKFPGKGHIKRVITCQEGTFEPAATGLGGIFNTRRQAKRALLSRSWKFIMILPNKKVCP